MNQDTLEQIEIELLLEAIYLTHGYDFRSYARASLDRRIRQFVATSEFRTISELIPAVLHDREIFSRVAQNFSICVTEMFRDPFVYQAIRAKVLPRLSSYPFFKVWHAGCASGEEVYSVAIVLQEEGLLERATLYATDFNPQALELGRSGIYPLEKMQVYTKNYQQAGGTSSFSDYYHARYDAAALNETLKQRITFAAHNLVTDGVFGETQLVFARNLLIYFNQELQNRVLRLFTDSLVHGGFLCLGTAESIEFSQVADCYEVVDAEARIYRKVL
ncbi:CheR family methyltransferase [Dongshaea marina]|uniref:CheR family methyltransferase n=1 Tax=Dongshaea marina TaxID=2047966 RepID=UPI000D3EBF22|nr:CheR family methyltransferase [Dongshaea marina]